MTDSARLQRLRRKADKLGYRIHKNRVKSPNLDDHGGYQVVDNETNGVSAGRRFDLDLGGVEAFLEEADDG